MNKLFSLSFLMVMLVASGMICVAGVDSDADRIEDLVIKKAYYSIDDYLSPTDILGVKEELPRLLEKYSYLRDLKPAVRDFENSAFDFKILCYIYRKIECGTRFKHEIKAHFALKRIRLALDELREKGIPEYQ